MDYNLLNATLAGFQKRVVRFLDRHPYCINASEMGTGKTIESIYMIERLNVKTIIVCPSYLRQNWQEELNKFLKSRKKIVIFKSSRSLCDYSSTSFDVGIVSYSLLKHSARLFKDSNLVVADEAHYLKNIHAERTKIFHELIARNKPENLQLLTGTPIKNDVSEYYSLLALTCYNRKHVKGKNFLHDFPTLSRFQNTFQFKTRFKIKGRHIVKFEGLKPSKKETLKNYLKDKIVRVLYSEVSQETGKEPIYKYVTAGFKKDSELEKQWAYFNSKGHKEKHTFTAKKDSAVKKAKFTADYVKDIYKELSSPVVVFSDHIDPLHIIKKRLKGAEIIQGSVNSDKRHEIVKRFQEGKVPYLLLTIGAGSTGFTLTKSYNCVFNDESWIPADNSQAKARVNRIGQTKKVIYHIICGSKVDKKISKTLNKKEKTIKEAL